MVIFVIISVEYSEILLSKSDMSDIETFDINTVPYCTFGRCKFACHGKFARDFYHLEDEQTWGLYMSFI